MNAYDDLDRRIADFYASDVPTRAPDRVLRSVLDSIDDTKQRRALIRVPWRFPHMTRRAWLVLAAAALVLTALGVIGLGALRREPGPDVITPNPVSLVWTEEGLVQDWPTPVRPEPPSGAAVVPMALGDDARWDSSEQRWEPFEYPDPVGDVGSAGLAWVDIREVHLGSGGAAFTLRLMGEIPRPIPDPASRWIAYGVVLDTNGDGIADVRIGMDNLPAGDGHRAWRTDLATGRTHSRAGAPYGFVRAPGDVSAMGSVGLDTYYPDESTPAFMPGATLRYSLQAGEDAFRFYAWASVIEAGRVLATDYAPDVGWLVEGSQPEPTLVGPSWTIESEFTRDGESMTLVQSLSFTAAGRMSFDAGCTTGDGTVVVERDILRIRDLVLLDASCGSDIAPFTARFLDVLTAGDIAYMLEPGVLELRTGTKALRFQAGYDGPPT
jgi:hypothetical protein